MFFNLLQQTEFLSGVRPKWRDMKLYYALSVNLSTIPNHLYPPQISPNASSFFCTAGVGVDKSSIADVGVVPQAAVDSKRLGCCWGAVIDGLLQTLAWAGMTGAAHPDVALHIPVPFIPIMLVVCCCCCCCGCGAAPPQYAAWLPIWPNWGVEVGGGVEKRDKMSCFMSFFCSCAGGFKEVAGEWKSKVNKSLTGVCWTGGGAAVGGCTACEFGVAAGLLV